MYIIYEVSDDMKILIASQNKHKIEEITKIFDDDRFTLYTLEDFNDDDDPIEDGKTFLENAIIKAKYFAKKYQIPTLSDDSGLCVEALHLMPGIYSKRYSGGNDKDNNDKLLLNLKGIKNRDAYFVSMIVIYFPDDTYFSFEGRLYGEIAEQPLGTMGFGYDPIFYVKSLDKHLAQLTLDEKNHISHRAQALEKVGMHLDEIINHK